MKKYKQHRKLITCICDCCGKAFEKPLSEYKRNISLKRSNYCSRSCSGKACNKNSKNKGNPNSLIANNRKDIYTPFRYYYRNAKRRYCEFDLTLEYLKELWESQKGICPYSGVKLNLSTYTGLKNNPIYSASLDRIDSSKGYVKGNVQYVSICMNYMKCQLTHEQTIKLCQLIADNFLSDRTISSSDITI